MGKVSQFINIYFYVHCKIMKIRRNYNPWHTNQLLNSYFLFKFKKMDQMSNITHTIM